MISEDDIIECSEAIQYSEDEERKRTIYFVYLEAWKVLVIASSDYSRLTLLKLDDSKWFIIEQEEKFEAILPTSQFFFYLYLY